jgi:hypothetical protein
VGLSPSIRSAEAADQQQPFPLILPDWHFPNWASRILSLCQKRLPADWQTYFGHRLVLLETFVDPQRFQGAIYKAAGWIYAGNSKRFQRTRKGYSYTEGSSKMVFVKPLIPNAQQILSRPVLHPDYHTGGGKIMLKAKPMESLFDFFTDIPDPRRRQGRRHSLPTVLSITAAATLCGMHGYQAISDWIKNLGQKARERSRCRCENGRYIVPGHYFHQSQKTTKRRPENETAHGQCPLGVRVFKDDRKLLRQRLTPSHGGVLGDHPRQQSSPSARYG